MSHAVAPPPRLKGEQKTLPLAKLFPSEANPRVIVDDDAQRELDADVAQRGVITPLIVRKADGGRYEILAGFRRYSAAKKAKLKDVPVRVVDAEKAEDAHEIMVIENLQRKDIHPIDEAIAFQKILERTNGDVLALSKRVNKKEPYIRKALTLNQLTGKFRDWYRKGTLHHDAAFAIARLQPADQDRLYKDLEDGDKEKKTVWLADVQNWTEREVIRDLTRIPWNAKDEALLPKAGACVTCPKRTSVAKDMFQDVAAGDSCTDSTCFGEKLQAHLTRARQILGSTNVHYKLISKNQYETEKVGNDTVLGTKDYLEAGDKKGECVTKGLIWKGVGIGTVLPICLNTKCKIHRLSLGNHGARVSPEEAAKLKEQRHDRVQETEVRGRILSAIVTNTADKTGLSPDDQRIILNAVFDRLWHEHKKRLLKRWDVLKPPSKVKVEEPPDYNALFRKHTEKMAAGVFAKILMEIALIDDVDPGPLDTKAERLYETAKAYKVDVAAIRKVVADEARAKASPKPKTKKAKAKK